MPRPSAPNAADAKQKEGCFHRKWSAKVVEVYERAASRAMLHAVGFTRDEFKKSQIGVASTGSRVPP